MRMRSTKLVVGRAYAAKLVESGARDCQPLGRSTTDSQGMFAQQIG